MSGGTAETTEQHRMRGTGDMTIFIVLAIGVTLALGGILGVER